MAISTVQTTTRSSQFLDLSRELRDCIYKHIISPQHCKTPKTNDFGLLSCTRYNWNINPAILRVSKQTHAEARECLSRENQFVVIQHPPELRTCEDDMVNSDFATLDLETYKRLMDSRRRKLWSGKRSTESVEVPGERMRVRLFREEAPKTNGSGAPKPLHSCVILVEELRDICTMLSIRLKSDGRTYATSNLSVNIKLIPAPYPERPQAQDEMRTLLLKPLTLLSHFEAVSVENEPPFISNIILRGMKRKQYTANDADSIVATYRSILLSGDQARDQGDYNMARAYYQESDDYCNHFIDGEPSLFAELEDLKLALNFESVRRRVLNEILDQEFDNGDMLDTAIGMALDLYSVHGPLPGPQEPKKNAQGIVTAGALREWKCERIKLGAEGTGQIIRTEDLGRCFYYRSICLSVMGPDSGAEQIEDDKLMGIGCCAVSETEKGRAVIQELLELDIKVFSKFQHKGSNVEKTSDDEWEDADDESEDQ